MRFAQDVAQRRFYLLQSAQYSETAFVLPKNESRLLNGAWTSGKTEGPEYAICNRATGTEYDNSVLITSFKFEAKSFQPFAGEACEDFECVDMKLVSQNTLTLGRGGFSEMLTDWLPPEPDKFSIRTYFPKIEEVDQMAQNWEDKCLEMTPKN